MYKRQVAAAPVDDFVQTAQDDVRAVGTQLLDLSLIHILRPVLKEYHEVFTGNVIAQQRLKGTGVLTREDAISFGATGDVYKRQLRYRSTKPPS